MVEAERKNLTLLVFVLVGTVFVLLFLNFRGMGRAGQKAEVLDALSDQGPFPTKLSKSEVSSFAVGRTSGKVVFYEKLDSMVYEIAPDGGNRKELARIPGAGDMVFSLDGRKVIATVSESGRIGKYVFDLTENKKTALDPKILAAAFSPDGSRIAYYLYDPVAEEGGIYIAVPGDQGIKILNARIRSTDLSWPQEDTIMFSGFAVRPDGGGLRAPGRTKAASDPEKAGILEELGIKASSLQINPFGNYLIYLNAGDKKLYSLEIRQSFP